MEPMPTENNALVNIEMEPVEPAYLDMQTTPETQPTKRRKKKSVVWEHFTIENVGQGVRRACCKQCKQSFAYSTGSKVAGTSHLKRHIAKGSCPMVLRNQAMDSQSPFSAPSNTGNNDNDVTPVTDQPKRRYRTANAPFFGFDSDRSRLEIAQMIIMHDYPLHIVEHPGFIAFVHNLQPRFDMVNFSTVQGDCIATYLREKQAIQQLIEGMPGRICLTLDLWNSCQTTGYVFVTGQFVDSDWKIHRKLLNVVMEPYPESDSAFSHAVSSCLSDWNIEGRLFSLTINQPLTETGIDSLRSLLSEKNPNILGGQLLLRNCLARYLSNIALEALKSSQETVKKVRDCVKYVKTSESLEEKFITLKQQLQVPSTKTLALDDQTQWNTTYEMLLAASELKEVFSCLDTSDPDYSKGPSTEEWKIIEHLCTYLKPLFETANLLTASTIPTTNTFFHEAWKIQLELTRAATSEDPVISGLTKPMLENFDKYWKSSCLILAIAVVMDPRFKIKLVEFSFTKIYGDDAAGFINIVDEGIHQLFLEYVGSGSGTAKVEDSESHGGAGLSNGAGSAGLSDFDMKEMDRYRCSLRAETVEALVCAKDWLSGEISETPNVCQIECPFYLGYAMDLETLKMTGRLSQAISMWHVKSQRNVTTPPPPAPN
ncbi:zinc finger, BED-type [Artemisia annua]|uniref:Zinc finger, BED-type n=1 Tax=Artemisia annua TaxID=35608 RepID=A0A2U1NXV0_ARTAN|nr:zinc finger, BED-type [Artemisia annua]